MTRVHKWGEYSIKYIVLHMVMENVLSFIDISNWMARPIENFKKSKDSLTKL